MPEKLTCADCGKEREKFRYDNCPYCGSKLTVEDLKSVVSMIVEQGPPCDGELGYCIYCREVGNKKGNYSAGDTGLDCDPDKIEHEEDCAWYIASKVLHKEP